MTRRFVGECGLRGGYFELSGFAEDVQAQLLKLASISLCSNTVGQVATGLMVRPPREGEHSFEAYDTERRAILDSLKRRALKLADALNKLEGVTCNEPQALTRRTWDADVGRGTVRPRGVSVRPRGRVRCTSSL